MGKIDSRGLIDVRAVADRMDISVNTVWRRIRNGIFIAPYNDGTNSRWLAAEVDAYLKFVFDLPVELDISDIAGDRLDEIREMAMRARARNSRNSRHNELVTTSSRI